MAVARVRCQYRREAAVLTRTRWAPEPVAGWTSSTDPGAWDARAALAEIVAGIEELRGEPAAPPGSVP